MGGGRIELPYLSVPHFECGASTSFAIRPDVSLLYSIDRISIKN